MLDMSCNSANICSYGIKQHKPRPSKYHVSLPHFDEIWLQQNQRLQQNLLRYEQNFFNQDQPASSSTLSPTLQYLLQQGRKRTEDRAFSNASQTNPYDSSYDNQYNSPYNDQIAPYMSNQNASSIPVQPHYQQTPVAPSSTEQHLQYQQQNVYCESGQSYLPRGTYSSNYNSLSMTPNAITQNLRPPIVRPLQEDNLYATQQYAAQQSYAGNNSKQQNQTAANNQESSVVGPSSEVLQEDNLYATQQYVTRQSYTDNNSKQQNQTAANNQESSVVRPPSEVLQEDNLYATQYVTQQSYASNNNEQRNHIIADDPKSKQQPIQHYAWMKFKHDPGNENKRARKRQTYTQQQTFRLEEVFYGSRYLSKAERVKLSKQLNLSEQQIKIWFQNRRMKAKKEQQQQLPVNQQCLRFNETPMQEQSISQQESVIHQQQPTVPQQQPSVQQQWPTTQQPQIHQAHQDYQSCPQQQKYSEV